MASVDAGAGGAPALVRSELQVESSRATNAGKVLHMLVRQLDAGVAGATESYEEVAAHVVAPVRDESVLATRPVLPGVPMTVTIQSAEEKRLVAYFFFTQPGQNWRVELPQPAPSKLSISLGQNEVTGLEVRRP